MSGKGPRRPKNQSGPAQSSAAWEATATAFQDPAKLGALASFLKGHLVVDEPDDAAAAAAEGNAELNARAEAEANIPMYLRNLSKSSKTTKTKALSELIPAIQKCRDERLASYLANFVEAVKSHVFHEDAQVRLLLFRVLGTLVEVMGAETKRALTHEIGYLMGPWIAGTGDIDAAVREAAKGALNTAFKEPEKIARVFAKFKSEMRAYFLSEIEECIKPSGGGGGGGGKSGGASSSAPLSGALSDDVTDPRANVICACLAGLGALAARLSSVAEEQSFVIGEIVALIDDTARGPLVKVIPHASKMLSKTPRVRAGYLQFLTAVVGAEGVPPLGKSVNAVVARSVCHNITDPHVAVASALWPLLLLWLKKHGADALAALPPTFHDTVITVLEKCEDQQRLSIIFQSLMPYAALTAKALSSGSASSSAVDERALDVLDDVMGAVIEKVKATHLQVRTGGAAVAKFALESLVEAWGCAAEIWELLALRKIDSGASDDCVEALSVLLQIAAEFNIDFGASAEGDAPAPTPTFRKTVDEKSLDAMCGAIMAKVLSLAEKRPSAADPLWAAVAAAGALFQQSDDGDAPAAASPLVDAERTALKRRLATHAIDAPRGRKLVDAVVAEIIRGKRWSELKPLLQSAGDASVTSIVQTAEARTAIVAQLGEPQAPTAVCDTPTAMLMVRLLINDRAAITQLLEIGAGAAVLPRPQRTVLLAALSQPAAMAAVKGDAPHEAAVWDIAAALASESDAAPFSAWIAAALDAGIFPPSTATLDRCIANIAATVQQLPPAFDHAVVRGEGSDADDDGDDAEGGMVDSDEDIETATTFTSTAGGQNLGADIAANLQSWIDVLGGDAIVSLVTGNTSSTAAAAAAATASPSPAASPTPSGSDEVHAGARFPELRPLVLMALQRCLRQVLVLSPHTLPEQYASQKYLGLVVRADGGNQHRNHTLVYVKSKQHSTSTEATISLVNSLAASFEAHGSNFADDVVAEVEDIVTSVENAPVVANSTVLAFFAEAARPPRIIAKSDVWDTLCAAIESDAIHKATGRALERQLSVYDASHEFSELNLTVDGAASAIRLGMLVNLVAELQHGAETALSFRGGSTGDAAEGGDARARPTASVELCARIVRVATLQHVLSDRARASLEYLLQSILLGLTKPRAVELVKAVSPFSLVTLAFECCTITPPQKPAAGAGSSASSPASAAQSVLRNSICVIQDVIAEVALTTPTWQRDAIGRIAAVVAALERIESTLGHADAPALHLTPEMERAAIQLVAGGTKRAGTLEWLRCLVLILRRQSRAHVFQDECTMACVECALAEKNDPSGALVLLSELSKATIMSVEVYTELCSALKHMAGQCCNLHHLPSNGRLGQRIPTARPLPVFALRELPLAMIRTYDGLKLHARVDDVLQSSINLVVFDTICEAVLRLRTTKDEEVPPLVHLIAQLTPFVSQLKSHETRTLAASEQSIKVIASVLSSTHMWLATCSVAKIESLGVGVITQVICCVNELAAVTLITSKVPCPEAVLTVTTRCPVRAIRQADALLEHMKLSTLVGLSGAIERSSKQKLCLFTYLMSWGAFVTNEQTTIGDLTPIELRQRLFPLLDLIAALALYPIHSSSAASGGGAVEVSGSGNAASRKVDRSHFSTYAADQLGFDIRALGHIQSPNSSGLGSALARGALSLLTFLLRSTSTANCVRDWLDTLDRALSKQIEAYVLTHVSPALIQTSLAEVLAESPEGKTTFTIEEFVTVTVGIESRTVEVVFVQEEASVGLKLVLPEAYPLRHPEIAKESTQVKAKGVNMEKWRSWMLKMTTMLVNGNSTLWQCVKLFAENVTKHYEGVEPCPICYSVIAQNGHRLPEMACSVCKNKFHNTCLYTWWGSSGNSSCPMCRSPWYSK